MAANAVIAITRDGLRYPSRRPQHTDSERARAERAAPRAVHPPPIRIPGHYQSPTDRCEARRKMKRVGASVNVF